MNKEVFHLEYMAHIKWGKKPAFEFAAFKAAGTFKEYKSILKTARSRWNKTKEEK